MKKILLLPFLFTFNLLLSQDSYKVEISSGYIVMDKFYHENDWANLFLTDYLQSQITLWKEFDFNRKYNTSIGVGYTNFRVLGEMSLFVDDIYLNYIHVRMNVNHQLFLRNLFFTAGSSFYYRTSKVDPLGILRQNFLNLDLGLCYKIGKKFQINLSTPLTIFPMYYGLGADPQTSDLPYVFFGETTGFNLGLSYTFYQNRNNRKPSL